VTAWKPDLAGVAEVFHAEFHEHRYPMHTHDAWTLLILDQGSIRFDLDRRPGGSIPSLVTLLPPHVPHDGRAATAMGFRKRVAYLDTTVLPVTLAGAAADRPNMDDPALLAGVDRLHRALVDRDDRLDGEAALAAVGERLRQHLRRFRGPPPAPADGTRLADRLRQLLDARIVEPVTLAEASGALGASVSQLVRSFATAFGLTPHAYVVARRIEWARRLMLDGMALADVAVAAGFHDQAHMTRHFKRYVGVTPARYRSQPRAAPSPM
jgi:AraC-like DNA-binding protein